MKLGGVSLHIAALFSIPCVLLLYFSSNLRTGFPQNLHFLLSPSFRSEYSVKDCDLSSGKWVFDNVTRPLYREEECEFLTAQVTCTRNGRTENLYQNWRWQPHNCSLPKFNGRILMEKLRGKRVLFVGDSLNRLQWESMVCLVNSALAPADRRTWEKRASFFLFFIQKYNIRLEFYWAPFLVESNSDDPDNHSGISERVINPESISTHGVHWKAADFLIFNTYLWWMSTLTTKVSGNISGGGWTEVERSAAYGRVMKTWAEWVNLNVDPHATAAFFIGSSPVHYRSSDWNNSQGIACTDETLPIPGTEKLSIPTDHRLIEIAKNAIRAQGIEVKVIDITTMSEYRKDAHTSLYTIHQGKLLTAEQKADPKTFADCIHWCLPGVPDTWNELLYAYILSS